MSLVDAVLSRYGRHVELTAAELERRPGVIRARPLTIDCWSAAHGRISWASAVQRLDTTDERAEQIADRVATVWAAGHEFFNGAWRRGASEQ